MNDAAPDKVDDRRSTRVFYWKGDVEAEYAALIESPSNKDYSLPLVEIVKGT